MTVADFEHERAVRRMVWTACADQMPEVGLVIRIKCGDGLGVYDVEGRHYLHDDGRFYQLDPAVRVEAKVTHWVMG